MLGSANYSGIVWDESQLRVLDAASGYHLVLAPPGCGKTQILAERMRRAHTQGVSFDDMLCLTFTNRAARGMRDRIGITLNDENSREAFVGNIHRFCSHFLFSNNIIASDTSIIDEVDTQSILARFYHHEELAVMRDGKLRKQYNHAVFLSHFMNQLAHGHPKALRIHPECLNGDDIYAMRQICLRQNAPFTPQTMMDMYKNADTYLDIIQTDAYDMGLQVVCRNLLQKMRVARLYEKYKSDNHLIDFEDLLILTYNALSEDKDKEYKRYSWIQVDETQDLNALQLALIDALTATGATVLYLGDEQQAIYSFMGAKSSMIAQLRQRCQGHIYTLSTNHRSPSYLLEVFNRYATEQLHLPTELLPHAKIATPKPTNALQLIGSETIEDELESVVELARGFSHDVPHEKTAILVSANYDADVLSRMFIERKLKHFKFSGTDLFATKEMKTLLAHLNILKNEHDFMAWAHLFHGLDIYAQNASAQKMVRSLLDHAILPSDALRYNGTTYVQEFLKACATQTCVVFDTETTGLDVLRDDVVQIAAMKVCNGQIIENSQFSVYIRSDKPLPEIVGNARNPLLDELDKHELLSPDEAILRFLDYAKDSVLIGHNIEYDYQIMRSNCRRYLKETDFAQLFPLYFDTLKLSRLLYQYLHQFTLEHLIEVLHLEGQNAHLADADVAATVQLLLRLLRDAPEIAEQQRDFLQQRGVKTRMTLLASRYQNLWRRAMAHLYDEVEIPVNVARDDDAMQLPLIAEMDRFYRALMANGTFEPIEKLPYLYTYIRYRFYDDLSVSTLKDDLHRCVLELNTLKEADLYNAIVMTEHLILTTVHKAKGMEFDNVIVFDVSDQRYPNPLNKGDVEKDAEDARKLYVAMSRAQRTLTVTYAKTTRYGRTSALSPLMRPIIHYFDAF